MKNLKILLLLVAIMAGSWSMEAKTVKHHPRKGVVVSKIYKPHLIAHKGTTFYYSKGIWYKPHGRKYVVIGAPAGIRVKFLPRGFKKVRLHGKRYYTFNGVWYVKSRGMYTVVKLA